jgi:hypothetical protein
MPFSATVRSADLESLINDVAYLNSCDLHEPLPSDDAAKYEMPNFLSCLWGKAAIGPSQMTSD